MKENRAGMKGREHKHDGGDVPQRANPGLQGSAMLPAETNSNSNSVGNGYGRYESPSYLHIALLPTNYITFPDFWTTNILLPCTHASPTTFLILTPILNVHLPLPLSFP